MTKKEIVQVAFKVWGQRFYRKTSLSQLAEELKVTKPALYKHFKSKEALCDAMFLDFFDRFANFILPYYNEALEANDSKKSMLLIGRSFIDFFIRNVNEFMFLIIEVHGNLKYHANMTEQLRLRCIDMTHKMFNPDNDYPQTFQLVMAVCFCMLASFHGKVCREKLHPGDDEITKYSSAILSQIKNGLNFKASCIESLDWEGIEKKIEACVVKNTLSDTHTKIVKSIIAALAADGPWNTSMAMIAENLGLSKSSLYSHFTNKLDIMRQIFKSITEDVVKHASDLISFSKVPEEQLYFAVMGIISYLKARPEILIMMDWIRVRSADFEKDFEHKCDFSGGAHEHDETIKTVHTIFQGIKSKNKILLNDVQTDCILFLIVNVLMRRPAGIEFSDIKQSSFRRLYRFMALGLE
jgi:AcrR family transcriptional regulator